MEVAVLEQEATVVSAATQTEYVTHTVPETAIVVDNNTAVVSLQTTQVVLVERDTAQVVVHGIMGPAGKDGKDGIAEEDIVYAKRVDFVGETVIYKGEAAVGSADSAPAWRIRRIVLASDSDVTETWASGTADFDKTWDNRANYSYS